MIHTTKDQFWTDESGIQTHVSRVRPYEKMREKKLAAMAKEAKAINAKLRAFKDTVRKECDDLYRAFLEEHGVDPGKGNVTLFSFDRSLKVEVSINETIEFDGQFVEAAKSKFDEFLEANVSAKDVAIKALVMDAFQTSRGKLDTKRVMNLLRYRSKIKDEVFGAACQLLEDGIRKPESRTYYRIWERTGKDGEHVLIDLNFSSI